MENNESKIFALRMDGINIIEKIMMPTPLQENQIFNFDIKSQCVPTIHKDIIATVVSISIKKQNEEKIIGRIICEIGIELQDSENIVKVDEQNKFIMPPELENLFKSICISTTRGIMYSEFRGTSLHGAVLPIIMMDTMSPIPGNIMDNQNTPQIVEEKKEQ